jgi:chromosome segregation ATPase
LRLKEWVEDMDESLVDLVERVDEYGQRLANLEKVVGAIASLAREFMDHRIPSKVEDLYTKLGTLENSVRALDVRDARYSKALTELNEALKSLSLEVRRLNMGVENLEKRLSEHESIVAELLKLYREYMVNLYSLLLGTLEELGMKPRDEFQESMALLRRRIDKLLAKTHSHPST